MLKKLCALLVITFALHTNTFCFKPSDHLTHDVMTDLLFRYDEKEIQRLSNDIQFDESSNIIDYILANPPLIIVFAITSAWIVSYLHENPDLLEMFYPILGGGT